MRTTTLALAIGCGLQLFGCDKSSAPASGDAEPLRVAAAADLSFAFKEVGAEFEKKTGKRVDFTFGATGLLAKQIEEGAPFDVFAGANISFVDEAIASGACDANTKATYAVGRVATWTKSGAAIPLEALTRDDIKKIAIANPDHAPYGKAAKEALQKSGLWDKVEKKLVYGENVQQTLQFAQSGNADVAIVALGLAMSSGGAYSTIDASLHAPLVQALVVCKGKGGARDRAKDFAAFVNASEGRAVMSRHGFSLPSGDDSNFTNAKDATK